MPWGRTFVVVADAAVALALVSRAAIGFINTDDYYYSLEARTLDNAGFVGNQFRFFDVPEVPLRPASDAARTAHGAVHQPVRAPVASLVVGLLVIDERGGSYSTMSTVAEKTTYPGFTPTVGAARS